jgi:hypothetical protein
VFERKLAAGRGGRELGCEAEQMVDRGSVGHEDILERLGRGISRPNDLVEWKLGRKSAEAAGEDACYSGEERRVRAGGGAAAVGAGAGVPQGWSKAAAGVIGRIGVRR